MVKNQTCYFYLVAKVKCYWTTSVHYVSIESLLVFLTRLKLALSGIPSSWSVGIQLLLNQMSLAIQCNTAQYHLQCCHLHSITYHHDIHWQSIFALKVQSYREYFSYINKVLQKIYLMNYPSSYFKKIIFYFIPFKLSPMQHCVGVDCGFIKLFLLSVQQKDLKCPMELILEYCFIPLCR